MQCNELTHDLLLDYENRDASVREHTRRQIATHLDTCARCKRRNDSVREIASLLAAHAGSANLTVPTSVDSALAAEFKELATARRLQQARRSTAARKPLLLRWMAAAAVLLLCLGLFTLLWPPLEDSPQPVLNTPAPVETIRAQLPQLPPLRDDILPSWSFLGDEPSRTVPLHIAQVPHREATPLRGDLNGDGTINSVDVLLCTSPTLFNVPPERADINSDGVVDIIDALLVARAARDAAASANAPQAVLSAPPPGDLNGDGQVDRMDSQLLSRMLADPAAALPQSADLNNDGTVDIIDALLMARKADDDSK